MLILYFGIFHKFVNQFLNILADKSLEKKMFYKKNKDKDKLMSH